MSATKALLVQVDGTVTDVTIPREGEGLKALQDFVGGYIDVVRCDYFDMTINDEGKYVTPKANIACTMLARTLQVISLNDYIAGDVVLTGTQDAEGEITDIDPAIVALFKISPWDE